MDCKDHPQNWKFIVLFAHVYPIIFQQGTCRNRILDYRLSCIYIYAHAHIVYTCRLYWSRRFMYVCMYVYIYVCHIHTLYPEIGYVNYVSYIYISYNVGQTMS